MTPTNVIRINELYVNYSQDVYTLFTLHTFRVSIVNLLDNNIEPEIDDNGFPFYLLLNPKTGNQEKVILADSDTSTKIYTNYQKGNEPVMKLCIQLIIS